MLDGLGYKQPNLVFVNEEGRFRNVSEDSGPGFGVLASSRGLACGDLDGDLDLVISNIDEPPTLLRNDSTQAGHWLIVDARGAVRVEAVLGERRLVRHRIIGGSFLSESDPRFHLGLGPASVVDSMTVFWPDGHSKVLESLVTDRVQRIER